MSEQVRETVSSVLDSIVENQEARKQAEAAIADGIAAKRYQDNPNAYVIALGRDYGLQPAHALNMIHIISGKPVLSAGARATFLKQHGYDWRPVVFTDQEVRLRFSYKGEPMQDANGKPLEVGMTIQEAERAHFVQNSRGKSYDPKRHEETKGNYDKFPKNMLMARVISNFHRWFASEVMGATVYDAGEVSMDAVTEATEQRVQSRTESAAESLKERLQAAAEVVRVAEVAQ
jgi:hypothetical protein